MVNCQYLNIAGQFSDRQTAEIGADHLNLILPRSEVGELISIVRGNDEAESTVTRAANPCSRCST